MTDSTPAASGPVYMVVSGETIDPARMGAYARALAASGLYEAADGYYINTPRPIAVFEGDPSPAFVTLIARFPSLDKARAFWTSETYQTQVKPLRQNPSAGDYTVTVYAEAELPPRMVGRVGSAAYVDDARGKPQLPSS